jgi:diguanylate cyclase (GGDEF)-like protein
MAVTLGWLYVAGAVLALVAVALPHWPESDERGVAIVSVTGLVVGLALVRSALLVSEWMIHLGLVAATGFVTLGVYLGHEGEGAVSTAILYVWVVLFAAHHFGTRAAVAHAAVAAAAYAGVLFWQDERYALAQWVFVMGTELVAGVLVGSLARQVRGLARVDALTQCANRRAWDEIVPRELGRSARTGRPLCVALFDLDNFKAINDEAGHHVADGLLSAAAEAWRGEMRSTDLLARYGGDEFGLVLPDCDPERATDVFDRLRAVTPPPIRFSGGIASWNGSEDTYALVARADRALYDAKRRGGDCFVIAGRR